MKLHRLGSVIIAAALLIPAGSALAQEESPAPAASLTPAAESLVAAFPAELGGISLDGLVEVAAADTPDNLDPEMLPLLEEVATGASVGLDAVLVGQAMTTGIFDEDPNGAWLIAIQVPGMEPETGSAFMVSLFTSFADEELVVSETEIAGRSVTQVASAEEPTAAFNVYAGGDIAWVIMTESAEVLEEAISQLP
jgi:hypothetical protein